MYNYMFRHCGVNWFEDSEYDDELSRLDDCPVCRAEVTAYESLELEHED
jgi:hypothetical protein